MGLSLAESSLHLFTLTITDIHIIDLLIILLPRFIV